MNGVPQAVVIDELQLWLRDGNPCLVVRELGRTTPFLEEMLAREFGVLAGDVYPGISQPQRVVPSGAPLSMADIAQQMVYYKLFDGLGIPRPSLTDFDPPSGKPKAPNSMGFGLLRLALTLRPNHTLGNGGLGTMFSSIAQLPVPRRYEFVAKETASLITMLRDHIDSLYRMDVRVDDERGPKLSFDIDAEIKRVPFRGTLRADYSVDPAKVDVVWW